MEAEAHRSLADAAQVDARRSAARERRRAAQQRRLADLAVTLNRLDRRDDVLEVAADYGRRLTGARRAAATHLEAPDDEPRTAVSSRARDSVWGDRAAVPAAAPFLESPSARGPLRLDGETLAEPEWKRLRPPGRGPLTGYLAVPLVTREAVIVGLLQMSGKSPGNAFTDEDEAVATQIADLTAAALARVSALERERDARADAEEQAKLRGVLANAGKAFAASLEVDETLRTLARFTLPGLADWCCVHLVTEAGDVRTARVEVVPGPRSQAVRQVLTRLRIALDQPVGPGAAIRRGQAELFQELSPPVLESMTGGEVPPDELTTLASSSGMVVPLRVRSRSLGAYTVGRFGRPFRRAELEFVRELGALAGLSLDAAHRYAFERDVALTLQRSLLPQELPPDPAVESCFLYLPGASGTVIGGDWYDIVRVPGGRLGLVVGDVMGRGIPAAAVMGQVRATVRAYAVEGHEPARVLERSDVVVGSLGEGQMITCLYAILDPAGARLTVASAGHLPPLVVSGEGDARFLVVEPNLPLGVGGRPFEQKVLELAPGSTVVLYTDGLVEGRDQPADVGMARLLAAARGAQSSPKELCERLLKAMGRDGDHDDDTTLLAVRLVPPDERVAAP